MVVDQRVGRVNRFFGGEGPQLMVRYTVNDAAFALTEIEGAIADSLASLHAQLEILRTQPGADAP